MNGHEIEQLLDKFANAVISRSEKDRFIRVRTAILNAFCELQEQLAIYESACAKALDERDARWTTDEVREMLAALSARDMFTLGYRMNDSVNHHDYRAADDIITERQKKRERDG